ncbi:dhhc zinc finger domain-containing protein [Cyclospora cayetanensis]|uniref:Dhhc zinc finger domain-containing protein n=1 Tax=Cyclospora cayetanensis TaxID=88456 RepID=A0A1D3CVV6_9EIME|nr:dhhc zinc finger domain-containing protein [Cyclospora cayetanensis]
MVAGSLAPLRLQQGPLVGLQEVEREGAHRDPSERFPTGELYSRTLARSLHTGDFTWATKAKEGGTAKYATSGNPTGHIIVRLAGDGAPTPSAIKVTEYIYACLVLFLSMLLIFALVPFTRFHLNLVLKNSTTIENMDQASFDRNRYDLGAGRNIEQVFGSNPCCWLVPTHAAGNRPVGDGVRWSLHYMVSQDTQVGYL